MARCVRRFEDAFGNFRTHESSRIPAVIDDDDRILFRIHALLIFRTKHLRRFNRYITEIFFTVFTLPSSTTLPPSKPSLSLYLDDNDDVKHTSLTTAPSSSPRITAIITATIIAATISTANSTQLRSLHDSLDLVINNLDRSISNDPPQRSPRLEIVDNGHSLVLVRLESLSEYIDVIVGSARRLGAL